jgi:hypothetical protein
MKLKTKKSQEGELMCVAMVKTTTTALVVLAVILCGGDYYSESSGVVHAVDFPSLSTRRCRRLENLNIFQFKISRLDEWMDGVARDVLERSLRFDEYWNDCDSAPQWVQWLFSGSCYKRLSLNVPSLTREERFILQSWGQCMAPSNRHDSSRSSCGLDDGFNSGWTTEDLVAIEQAVETLACSSSAAAKRILHLNTLGRMPLSLLWLWFRFRNEYLLPLVLGKDRFETAFPKKMSSPFTSRTLACMVALQYQNVRRACRCSLTWERILLLLALLFVGLVAWLQETMESSLASSNRMARPINNSAANSPMRHVDYAHYHPPLPRRSRRRYAARSFREPTYDSTSFFRMAAPRIGSSKNSPTRSFRPRRLLLGLESRVRYETECPCCFQEYQIAPPEFNDSARLPILSEACIHSYCLDCATRDRDMVMKRQGESVSAFSSASLSARTTTALSYLYGMDNDEDYDHDDDDDHGAVRCPFCREPDAFEVDRPILRPDAYAAYRKQKRERQIMQMLCNNDDNDKTDTKNATTKTP